VNQPVNWVYSVSQPEPKSTDWLTVAQLIFSGFFTFTYGAAAVWLLAFSIPEIPKVTAADPSLLVSYSLGISCAILSLFNLASAYYSGKKLHKGVETIRTEKRFTWLNGIVGFLPILIIIGVLIFSVEVIRFYLLPILTALVIVVGVVWLIRIGSGDGWGAHPQRDSGMISLMTGFTIWFIMLLEMMTLVVIGIILLAGVISDPELLKELSSIVTLLQTQTDPTEMMQTLESIVSIPLLIGLGFLLVAVIMPIIEELFKTIGVWTLAGRNLTLQEGWVAGLMSGAAFALVEGLFYSVQMVSLTDPGSWVVAIIGRSGGSLLHTFCGGLIGWAFAKAWQDHKLWRVVGMYALVILIHGIWNGLALIPAVNTLGGGSDAAGNLYSLPLVGIMIVLFFTFISKSRSVVSQA